MKTFTHEVAYNSEGEWSLSDMQRNEIRGDRAEVLSEPRKQTAYISAANLNEAILEAEKIARDYSRCEG